METDAPEKDKEETPDNDSDWNNRVLCSDGNCIGVIGSDGCCKACGKKYEGDLPVMSDSEHEDQPVAEDEDPTVAPEEIIEADVAPVDEEWGNRVLCSDGSCIGVIGPDGNCKECGKPYEP